MTLIFDNTISFDTGAAYTYTGAEVEFEDSGARLKNSFGVGSSNVITPAVAITGWNLHSVVAEYIEQPGYEHLVFVTFDGTQWMSYGPGGWKKRAIADIGTYGMPLALLNTIREWPTDGTSFKLAIRCTRSVANAMGLIYIVRIWYGEELIIPTDEPDGTDILRANPLGPPSGCDYNKGIVPDYPFERTIKDHFETMRTDSGHELAVPLASESRESLPFQWNARTEGERDQIVLFIRTHQDVAFRWMGPAESEYKKYVFGEPEVTEVHQGVYNIRCEAMQVLPRGDDRNIFYYRQRGESPLDIYQIANQVCGDAFTSSNTSADTLRATPFPVRRGGLIKRIAMYKVGAGTGNARIGIYKATSHRDVYPDELVADFGAKALGAGAQMIEWNDINIELDSNQLYWLAFVCDTGISWRKVDGSSGGCVMGFDNTLGGSPAQTNLNKAFTYAALPSTFPAGASIGQSEFLAFAVHEMEPIERD